MTDGMSKWTGSLVVDDPRSACSAVEPMDGLARADHLPAAAISWRPMTADILESPVDVNELLQLICVAAIDAVPRAEYAGITLADRHGNLETHAATHPLVHRLDALQYELNQGPCVDAVQGRWQPPSNDLRRDVRWPKYGPLAADLGIVSQLGIELCDDPGLIAGLNLYSSTIGAFDDDSTEAAMVFAIQASHTLGRVMTQEQLADAVTNSATIGRATGVVMERFMVSADRAFELLTRVSQIHDLTLEVVADQILDDDTNPAKHIATERASRVDADDVRTMLAGRVHAGGSRAVGRNTPSGSADPCQGLGRSSGG